MPTWLKVSDQLQQLLWISKYDLTVYQFYLIGG